MALGTIGFFILGIVCAFAGKPWPMIGCWAVTAALFVLIQTGHYHR